MINFEKFQDLKNQNKILLFENGEDITQNHNKGLPTYLKNYSVGLQIGFNYTKMFPVRPVVTIQYDENATYTIQFGNDQFQDALELLNWNDKLWQEELAELILALLMSAKESKYNKITSCSHSAPVTIWERINHANKEHYFRVFGTDIYINECFKDLHQLYIAVMENLQDLTTSKIYNAKQDS